MTTPHPDPERYWKVRRRMMYFAVAWSVIQTFLWVGGELMAPGFISSASVVVGWSYGTASTIIIGYFGNTAVDTYRQNRRQSYSYQQDSGRRPWESGGV